MGCALLGIALRSIRTKRRPDSGQKLRRKAFPHAVKTIGDLLRKRRVEKGLKLKKLALLLKVANNLVTEWEHDLAIPASEQWQALSQLLNLPSTPTEAQPNS